MIEIGIVKKYEAGGVIEVEFPHLETSALCHVLVPTTGDNNIFILPSIGTQVVASLEDTNNIILGAIYSDQEPVPGEAAKEGLYLQIGQVVFSIKENKVALKNDLVDVKTILKDVLTIIKNLTVSTSMGPSGTPLPPTITAIQQCEQTISKLFE